ncbi:PLC-like phosphodiesterase [Mollisia scopiformis]|uniref:PLC-like phosphodiesterase n=1 Tax=Mollisia scopiformis TaxID=149040 RepID=A0A194WVC3_MOLSC|nr:PLC-like phosphodiesterase [Mollisia scopiformis]KUJ11915.1 PLC-like phosphodiesterase [Mollisia scopiformis]
MLLNFLLSLVFAGLAAAQCNGNTALCGRQYSNVSFIGTHDSAFVGVLPTDNQLLSVTDQLNAGIRFLQAQTHLLNGALELCHTSCIEEDSGTLVSYLTTVNTWIAANPNEVLTILLTNGDNVDVSLFGNAMSTSGLSAYAYTPPSGLSMSDWPTLQELITAGTRLIMFLDYGADTATVPYISNEFAYYFETAYDVTDSSFPSCALDRPPGSSGSGLMMIVNHFLDLDILGILIPDELAAGTTNAVTGTGSIGAQASLCYTTWGRLPNVVLVDYFELGDVFTAQNTLNGL